LKGEPDQSNKNDFDDVQSHTSTLYHFFRLSLELIICIGDVYLGLHVSQAWTV